MMDRFGRMFSQAEWIALERRSKGKRERIAAERALDEEEGWGGRR
jgi:hypothetical protein